METTQSGRYAGQVPAAGPLRSRHEHDACGVGFVVNIKGRRSHAIVSQALTVLINLLHRGACGCEANTGDGAGILIQMPHVPAPGSAAAGHSAARARSVRRGLVFLPATGRSAGECQAIFERDHRRGRADLLGWREVPTNDSPLGRDGASRWSPCSGRSSSARGPGGARPRGLRAQALRHPQAGGARGVGLGSRRARFFYVPSLSANTLIYKGMLIGRPDRDHVPGSDRSAVESALALVHQRFSTNTFPSWPLAHPYRYIAHNGEINTLRGNINWMHARESLCAPSCLATTSRRFCRSSRGRQRLGDLRQRARVPGDERDGRCRTQCS